MNAIDIIKKAIYYPLNNVQNWILVALIFLVKGVFEQLALTTEGAISGIMTVISILISIVILGLVINIIRETISGSNELSLVNPQLNVIDGIKSFILQVVYFIIPGILTFIVSLIVGVYDKLIRVLDVAVTQTNTTINSTAILSSIPSNLTNELFISIAVVVIIGFILYIIFAMFSDIGQAILAETGSIFAGLNITKVVSKINSIGWEKYITYVVLLFLLMIVFALISGIITSLPYIGRVIASFIFESYMLIVTAHATGLIYMEG